MILGLETSTHSGGAALLRFKRENGTADKGVQDDGLTGSICFSTRELYSQRLLPSVEWLMTRTGVSMEEISLVGVSRGPGSFTGLRIGLSVAKALAYASGARIIGVGTLEALAVRASGGRDCLVCPLLDARQGQVYAGLYNVRWVNGLPQVSQQRHDWAGPIQEVAAWISGPTVFAGDALTLAKKILLPLMPDYFQLAPVHRRMPHPEEVALLTAARAKDGLFDDPVSLEPKYVRNSYTATRAGGAA